MLLVHTSASKTERQWKKEGFKRKRGTHGSKEWTNQFCTEANIYCRNISREL